MERAAAIVLYDETCRFCTAAALALERHGVVVAPIGSGLGERLLRDLEREQRYATLHAVDHQGRRFSGGRALPLLLDTLPGGRPLAAVARRFPLLAEAGYRAVARSRGRLSRVTSAVCRLTRASRARAD